MNSPCKYLSSTHAYAWQTQPCFKSAAQTKRVTIPSYTMQESKALGPDSQQVKENLMPNAARAVIVTGQKGLALTEQLQHWQFLWFSLDNIQHKSEGFARYCIQ